MKKYLLLILFYYAYLASFGQGNIVVYQNNGRNFTLIVNGVAQNMKPASNIKLININVEILDIEILFENGISTQRSIMSTQGFEIMYQVKKNRETNSPFIYFDKEIPLKQSLTYRNQLVIEYQQAIIINHNHDHHNDHHNNHNHTKKKDKKVIIVNGCMEMENQDFLNAKKSINSKSFASSKMTLALQILKMNCLSVTQVKEMANLFSFEDDKLEFVKAAYDKTTNKESYYLVNDVFRFSQSIEQLNNYLNKK